MKVAIVGAGAAGMMCVATLIEGGFFGEIHLFDQNSRIGAKVAITGGGRCNLTTALRDRKKILSCYPRGAEFLDFAMSKFSPLAVCKRFEKHGVQLKIEEGNKVFPQSNKSSTVISVFSDIFSDAENVFLHLGEAILGLTKNQGEFILLSDRQEYFFDVVVVATGGVASLDAMNSGPYARAQKLGHTIVPLAPSLSSFLTGEDWTKDLSGISFPRARIYLEDRFVDGPLLFTHRGISGPVVFAASAYLAYQNISEIEPYHIFVQIDIEKGFSFWDELLIGFASHEAQKSIKNCLSSVLFSRFVQLFLTHYFPHLVDEKISRLTKEDRKKISHLLSGKLSFSLIGKKGGDEFVTAGGIDCAEVDTQTMQSNIVKNLYFAGECLNVDGLTGGFNLQAAWATGRLVAQNIILQCFPPNK